MKKLLLIFTGLSIGFITNAQTPGWDWASSSDEEGSNKYGYDISADPQGNTYSVGVFKDTITFGGTQLLATQGTIKAEVFVVKYDPSGNVVWAIQSTGGSNPEGNGIYVDNSGNCYITGKFQNTIDFGGISETSSNPFGCMYVAKIDANGAAQWVQGYGAPGFSVTSGITGGCITMDNAQGLYVGGVYKGDADFGGGITLNNPTSQAFAPFVAKFSANGGTTQWAYGATGGSSSNIEVNDIELGSDIYIGGTFSGNVYFGTTDTITNTSNREAFLAKFSTAGNLGWVYQPSVTGGSGNVIKGMGVGVDNQNNVYFTGYFSNDITFGTTPTLSCGGFTDNTFVAKIDPSGTALWATQIGEMGEAHVYGIDMFTGTDGTSFITGSMSAGYANIGPDSLYVLNGDVGDLFAVEIDANGTPQWAVKADNPSALGDGANGIVGTNSGIYINGFYRSTLNMGSSTITESGNENFFIAKIGATAAVGIKELEVENLSSYPNPFTNELFIDNSENLPLTINLIDVAGQLVNTTISSDNIISVATSSLANGIYFIRITNTITGELITTKKVIKQ